MRYLERITKITKNVLKSLRATKKKFTSKIKIYRKLNKKPALLKTNIIEIRDIQPSNKNMIWNTIMFQLEAFNRKKGRRITINLMLKMEIF
jgi:rRNA-processing protein FCF1